MRIFNSDGTEPEMCGNGLRCVGRYVIDILRKDKVIIETMKAKYTVTKMEDLYEGVETVEIIIDSITFDVADLPLNYAEDKLFFGKLEELSDTLSFSAVSVTNPHIISIVDEIEVDELVQVGKKANSTPSILPKGVNVSFVKILDEKKIYVKTYERGVGLTKACGTGMTASVVIACIAGKCDLGEEISIYNDGGMIKCIVNKAGEKYYVQFIGNATYVFKGQADLDNAYSINTSDFDYESFSNETQQYEKMYNYTREVIK